MRMPFRPLLEPDLSACPLQGSTGGLDLLSLGSSESYPQQQTCASGPCGAADQDAEAVADRGIEQVFDVGDAFLSVIRLAIAPIF